MSGGLNINICRLHTSLGRNPLGLEKTPNSIGRILNVFVLNSKNFIIGHTTLLHVPDQFSPRGCSGVRKYQNSVQKPARRSDLCGNKSVSLRDKHFFQASGLCRSDA